MSKDRRFDRRVTRAVVDGVTYVASEIAVVQKGVKRAFAKGGFASVYPASRWGTHRRGGAR